ncbi:MAG: hypothetical protein ACREX3_10835 [Gammaproteobacteria bacterium]
MQVKHRGSFIPPRYDLFKPDVSISVASKLAETFNLTSTGVIVNQNATSNQYLSFRYFPPGEPFRYLDASIGLDQAEVLFSNPATVPELTSEFGKIWTIVFENLRPVIASNYVEATLHCETAGLSTKSFLGDFVKINSNAPEIHRGFSLTSKAVDDGAVSRISFDVSDAVPDGLYVVFGYVSTTSVQNMVSFEKFFNVALTSYRRLQKLASVELVEPT